MTSYQDAVASLVPSNSNDAEAPKMKYTRFVTNT